MLTRQKPLTPSELPPHLRHAYDFENQFSGSEGKARPRLYIPRTCLCCGKKGDTAVFSVRAALKKGNLTGLCPACTKNLPRDNPTGAECWNWNGGKTMSSKGYVMVRRPDHPKAINGYVQEHRLVMEAYLGRYLSPQESVHHKNGIKTDNSLENLELWGGKHSRGQRYEDMRTEDLQAIVKEIQSILSSRGV